MDDTDQKPEALPAPPELFTVPYALIEQWIEIPSRERLTFPLTRQDIDHLLTGLLRGLEAQNALDQTLIGWSNGKTDEANAALVEFRKRNAEAQNSIRQLITAIMASALRERKNG